MSAFLSASAAAARLQITRASLYAYVSRGFIRSRAVEGQRSREYARSDVERLVKQKQGRRDPSAVARRALEVDGMPVLSSALCLIEEGRLYYRGREAVGLSRRASFEDVAALLWDGPCEAPVAQSTPKASVRRELARLPFAAAAQVHLATVQAEDPRSYDLSPPGLRSTGARILSELAGVATSFAAPRPSIAETLSVAWSGGERMTRAIDSALILSADHELNASAFAARVIASTAATPYMTVIGALAALSGHRHGGASERVAEMLEESGDPSGLLVGRLRRGEALPGFGHPLYPDGDPRAARLLALSPRGAERTRALRFARAAKRVMGALPNLDFGLVALCRSLALPRSAPFILFALGRTAGWLAHALEQYTAGALIRPRARYVGPMPPSGGVTGGQ